MTQRHKVFVSYHHANDQRYRDDFERMFANSYDIMVSRSVQIGDIDENQPTDRVRQIIRDEYLRDSSVTVVLIGSQTWQRKHVDWEISSSIRKTCASSRSGLIGILLPSYQPAARSIIQSGQHHNTENNSYSEYYSRSIPPRLYDNRANGFASIYGWSTNSSEVQRWIHQAFKRKDEILPNNQRTIFSRNRSGSEWQE